MTKLAVVTGGARGIGKALAVHLSNQGHNVIAVDKNKQLVNLMTEEGTNITKLFADVGTPEGQAAVKKMVGDRKLDFLCHVAAEAAMVPLLEQDLQTFRTNMASNAEAPIFLTQALLPNIKLADGKCRITFHGSQLVDDYVAMPTMGGYIGSKCALKSIYKHLKLELEGIALCGMVNVNFTDTDIFDDALKDEKWPLAGFLGPRLAKNGGTDHHPRAETAQWIATILDESKCNDATFQDREHAMVNPADWYGMKLTETTEIKAALGKHAEAAGTQAAAGG